MCGRMKTHPQFMIGMMAVALASCGGEFDDSEVGAIASAPDPLVAAALNDPLMVDPDLVHRSDANALISVRYDHALPAHLSTTESANAAQEAATRELLETGSLADLPLPSTGMAGEPLALGMTADEIITASGAPSGCLGKLGEGLVWAARMPDPARVMPHGMAMQAAGADRKGCNIRIVRYITPVGVEDALRYHFNRADRAGMTAKRYTRPEDILEADRGSQHLKVHVRPGPGGTSAVDLIYWRR